MRQIIWTSDDYTNEEARKDYEECRREELGDDQYELAFDEWCEVVDSYFDDERDNLNEEIDGVIIAFADLGLWHGRKQGYKILGTNINDIFGISEDFNEWYGDGNNIRGELTHHDGTHHILYRVAKDFDEAERIGRQVYMNEIDEAGFRKRTRSLYPHVAQVYGWKAGRFNKKAKATK